MYGEVTQVERLTPAMVRVVLGGEGLAGWDPSPHTDQYVNALFVPDGAPYAVPFDVDEARAAAPEHRPRGRRYTIRRWDEAARQLTIDFVVHGDVGYAGRWATHARPGDRLQIVGPAGGYAPSPDADWHLMVGDESALPAIAASLEALRPGARAVVVVAVDGPDGELPLHSPGDVEVHWVHRHASSNGSGNGSGGGNQHGNSSQDGSGSGSLLAAVEGLAFPPGTPELFVHGEAAEVRAVRKHLLAERGLSRDGASISPYWRRGLDDEGWRQVKAAWVAEVSGDA